MTEGTKLPFHRMHIRAIALELFEQQPRWRTKALTERISHIHKQRGGEITTDPTFTVKRLLSDLKDEGAIVSVGNGYWNRRTPELVDESDTENDAKKEQPEPLPSDNSVLVVEKEIGSGSECVYLYFNPNDKELALLQRRDFWECKIGRTGQSDPSTRVLGQGIRTALSRNPVLGLVIRTNDSAAIEKMLHASLKITCAEVDDSPGDEWFMTSPDRVQEWFYAIQTATSKLDIDVNDGG